MVDLDAVRVNFDGITYAKGASALRQLVAWVGEEEFLAGVRNYFATHAWGNTELRDLLTELEATSGRDLSEWTAEWLQTSGVNLLRPSVEVAPTAPTLSVVDRAGAAVLAGGHRADPALAPHRPRPVRRHGRPASSGASGSRSTSSAPAPRCRSSRASVSPTCSS